MAGHRPFDELTKDWSPERRRRVHEAANSLIDEMRPLEGRLKRQLTQENKEKPRRPRPLPSPLNQTQPPGQRGQTP